MDVLTLHSLGYRASREAFRAAVDLAIREDVRAQIVAQIPAGRLAMPEEVADSVSFLASDKAGYITGTNLSVNGGLHMYA